MPTRDGSSSIFALSRAATFSRQPTGEIRGISKLLGQRTQIASADMVDANVGYLTLNPSNKPIYKTTNGGTTWTALTTPLAGQIKTVCAIDPNLVYIGSSFGASRVAKSTDGGSTWTPIALPATLDVTSLDFQDANTGYVCGNSTTGICRTTDGGASWSVQNSHTNTLVRVYAGPSGRGWALGMSASILRWAASLPPTPTPGPTATPGPTPTPAPTPTPPPLHQPQPPHRHQRYVIFRPSALKILPHVSHVNCRPAG